MIRKKIQRDFEIKRTTDDGIIEGYASVYGELDSYRDIVVKGAFNNSLEKRYRAKKRKGVPMLDQHDSRVVIGLWELDGIKEDNNGLLVRGQINMDVQRGRENHSLAKQGALSGLSIGYNTIDEDWAADGTVRILKEVDLWEISMVTFPAGDSARIHDVKSIVDGLEGIRDIEHYLCDAGHSKSEACAIIARIKALTQQGDPADREAEAVKRLKKAIAEL